MTVDFNEVAGRVFASEQTDYELILYMFLLMQILKHLMLTSVQTALAYR